MECNIRTMLALTFMLALSSCTLNPFTTDNKLTGSAGSTAVGAGIGAGVAWLVGASKPIIIGAGLGGAAVGYYVSTLRFASGGVIKGGGQVFAMGDYVAIEIPTDQLFEPNTAELLDDAGVLLDSAAEVLRRYPNDNIIISANTSGFGSAKFEHKLSEDRARQVSAYLWAHGINDFQNQSMTTRKLTYVGYGNYFPIANNIRNDSIRQNSRIQITGYPTAAQLGIDRCSKAFNNIGALDSEEIKQCENPQREEDVTTNQDYREEFKERLNLKGEQ